MDTTLLASLLAIVGFLAGMFLKDKVNLRKRVKQATEKARQDEQKGAQDAKRRYEERIKEAKEDVATEIRNRPVTGDHRADLADRIRRHRARKSRQRSGQ